MKKCLQQFLEGISDLYPSAEQEQQLQQGVEGEGELFNPYLSAEQGQQLQQGVEEEGELFNPYLSAEQGQQLQQGVEEEGNPRLSVPRHSSPRINTNLIFRFYKSKLLALR